MLSVIKSGIEYKLDDGTIAYLIGDEGWGMPEMHRLFERGPLQHGKTDVGFRLDARVAQIVLFIIGNSRDDMYDKRSKLLDIFSPTSDPVKLKWSTSVDRQIDCFFNGEMSMTSNERGGFNQKVVIQLVCPSPTFYDPASRSVTFSLGGGSDALVIPMAVPMVVGASVLNSINTLTYSGNWATFPHLIRINGPITNPVIVNETTDEKLDFTGITISGGDYYDLNLVYGAKTVVDSSGVNKIAELTDDSDLATWHIAADPEALGGNNSIRVTGSAITENTSIDISYFERFIGR